MGFVNEIHATPCNCTNNAGTSEHTLPSGLILISVLFFVLSTEASLYDEAPWVFDGVEDFTVLVFTLEYGLRVSTLSVSPKWGWGSSE